jgi:hypothetical protein
MQICLHVYMFTCVSDYVNHAYIPVRLYGEAYTVHTAGSDSIEDTT